MEFKKLQFEVQETKESVNSKGQPIGIITGLAAAFSLDETNDIILPGAFLKTIKDHKDRNDRPVRFKFQHERNRVIGIFPIMKISETGKGLFVEGQANLEVKDGFEAFSLAKQGAMTDFSIGFTIPPGGSEFNDDGIRIIKEIDLMEISIVDEPANRDAVISEVKGVVPFHDLPLASFDTEWDEVEAEKRVRKFTNELKRDFSKAFLWIDSDKKNSFCISDVVDGKLKAVPKAIIKARIALEGETLEIPTNDMPRIKQNINKYFRKINKEFDQNLAIPFKSITIENELDIKTIREVDDLLIERGFSRLMAKRIISIVKHSQRDADSDSLNDRSKQKDTLQDASVHKLDHIVLIEKLNTIIL